MKKALLKDTVKEIKNTYKRFISILLMAFLGVGFFAGLRASSPDMVDTIDKYYDNQKVYDIQILSTLGLTEQDLQEIAKVENVEVVYGSYEADGKIETENKEIITKCIAIGEMNIPVLIEGKMPENENECLVEESFLKANNKKIGDTIQIEIENTQNDNGEEIAYLKNNQIKIVGTAQNPLYISRDRGTSKLGAGKIDYYIYISKDNINAKDIYTSIYVKVKDVEKYDTSSEKYEESIEKVKEDIEEIKSAREAARKEQLVDSANKKLEEARQKIADAEQELTNAKDKINEIENPKWYILDRNANVGYVGFIQDTESIENIGKVFPIVFFAVATLISLTSMTRMVEEQRMQIGTLKSLGYNEIQIAMKYVIYAGLACIIGGILGMSIGFVLLPKIIWMMYGMMYQLPDISISFNLKYGGLGLALIFICVVGATMYTVLKELISVPAVLMRPKAPRQGNRVFLEKIPFIWKKLNFSNKVTIRNLFRYKKRFFMTIIGITGCTALILTGFALKDSIKTLLPNQYKKVFNYSMQINLKDNLEDKEKEECITNLSKNDKIEKMIRTYMTSTTVVNGEKAEDVQIIIPEDEKNLEGIININDVKTREKVVLKEDEICLTDKAAQLLEVKQGDTITLRDSEENEVKVKVSNIVENYISHYIFMSKDAYENIYKTTCDTNVLLIKNIELTEEEQDALATEIMSKKEVASVTNITSVMTTMDNTMQLLNYVVLILIISAGLLAFVVLYNLANVNISERIRELATIKVLGFYDKEVYDYITRETIILTIIGILLGLAGGYFLNYFVLGTCEINVLRFEKIVKPISYIYAILITIIFTVIVNVMTYFSLKKINMIENLKSVE